MKQFQAQFKKQAGSIKLSAPERTALRERLVTYMEYHPLADGAASTPVHETTPSLSSEPFFTFRPSPFYIRNLLGVLTLFLVIGVPVVAEYSVPGDVLYPVKVQFNEEVRGSLARNPYDKVVWETERLERRIAEARVLAKEGKLTLEAEAQVAAAVRAHSDAAQEEIELLRDTDSDEAAIAEIAFNSALDIQSAVLRSGKQESTEDSATNMIAGAVDAERSEASEKQLEQVFVSIERLQARVEFETTRAYEYLETVKEFATAEELKDIERRLADIDRKVMLAYQEETSTEDATIALRGALTSTQKLIAFMTDIDVRESVTIEELVPVELTDEEREAAAKDALDQLATDLDVVEDAQDDVANPSVAEKANEMIDEVTEEIEAAQNALKDQELTAAEAAIKRATDIMTDLRALFDLDDVVDLPVPELPATTTDPELLNGEVDGVSTSTAATTSPIISERATSSEAGGSNERASSTDEANAA